MGQIAHHNGVSIQDQQGIIFHPLPEPNFDPVQAEAWSVVVWILEIFHQMEICKAPDLIMPRCIPLSIARGTNNYKSNIGVMPSEGTGPLSQTHHVFWAAYGCDNSKSVSVVETCLSHATILDRVQRMKAPKFGIRAGAFDGRNRVSEGTY